MNGFMVWLGPLDKTSDRGSKFVGILFDEYMGAETKGDLLREEFGIPNTITIERQMGRMGALSAAIRLEGEKKARLEDATRTARLLLQNKFEPKQIVGMIYMNWPELTENEVLDAVHEAETAQ